MIVHYWWIGSPVWEHWRKYFQLSVDEAKERWFWKTWRARYGF